jgi:hypothetical protein
MRTFLLICLTSFVLAACSGEELPKGVLHKEKMENVMWDMMLADELSSIYTERGAQLTDSLTNTGFYAQVLKLHGIDKKTFRESLRFYEQRPDLFQEVLDALKKRSDTSATRPQPTAKPVISDSL